MECGNDLAQLVIRGSADFCVGKFARKLAYPVGTRYLALVSDDRRTRSHALRQRAALVVACATLGGCLVWAALVAPHDHLTGLSIVLVVAAVAAGLGVASVRQRAEVSAAFLVIVLAAAFLGPASAFVAAVLAEIAATRVIRTRPQAFLNNLAVGGLTALLAGTLIRALAPVHHDAAFYLVLGALALGAFMFSWLSIASLSVASYGYTTAWSPRALVETLPSALITVALAVAGAAIYVELGLAGITFALVAVLAFSYMSYLLAKSRERAHVLVGLSIAVANIDDVIALIRKAPDPGTAREELMARAWPAMDVEPLINLIDEPGRAIVDGKYRLSEAQAKAILDLRLHRLTGLERDKIGDELKEIGAQIKEFLEILSSRPKLLEVLRGELLEIRNQFATPRRTTIEDSEFEADIEDLIAREDMVVTVTNTGYIKRVPLSTYRAQKRGGKGRSGMSMKEEDFISQVFVANTHTPMLFFSSTGQAYKLKVYRLPLGTPQAKGKAMVNILPLDEGETISTVMPMPEDESTWSELNVMFATSVGDVRRNQLSDFVDIRANGKIAMKLGEGERLIAVRTCSEEDDVLLATRMGKAIRFRVGDVRVFKGRDSTGVRGIRLDGDEVISMSILRHVEFDMETRDAYQRGDLTGPDAERMSAEEEIILTVTQNGYGKRTSAYEYRITGRGGQGIANIDLTDKNGPVVASFPVNHEDEIMLVSDGGKLIRMPVHDIRVCGRKTQGVMLFRTAEGERVVSVARLCDLNSGDGAEDGEDEGEELPGGENE